jgi:hypothetical protein
MRTRAAFDAEHTRRLTAEVLAEFAARVSGARSRQDIADAVVETMGRPAKSTRWRWA